MRSKTSNSIAFIMTGLASLLVVLSPVRGQIMYGLPASGGAQVVYSHWSLEDDSGSTTISQFTVPLRGFVPIQDNLEALFYIASSSNSLELADADYSLTGLGDVRMQLNRSFNDDRILVSVGVNLPTGKKKLDFREEFPVIQKLAQNYLSFPLRRFGEGVGFNVLLGGAQMLGSLRYGAGVMYQFNGKYDPYEGVGAYDPGDFISINAGADWQQDKTTVAADVIFTSYASDKLDGAEVFKQSTEVDLRLSARHGNQDYSVNGSLGYLLRGRNTLHTTDEELKIYGNEFWISGNLTRRLRQDWYITPSAELKLIAANENGLGNATIFGFGGAVGRQISERVGLNVGFKYFTGNADGGDIDLSGFQLTANLTANL